MTAATAKARGWLLPVACTVLGVAALGAAPVIAWRLALWLAASAFRRLLGPARPAYPPARAARSALRNERAPRGRQCPDAEVTPAYPKARWAAR
jgi:hypothetical protein